MRVTRDDIIQNNIELEVQIQSMYDLALQADNGEINLPVAFDRLIKHAFKIHSLNDTGKKLRDQLLVQQLLARIGANH